MCNSVSILFQLRCTGGREGGREGRRVRGREGGRVRGKEGGREGG